MVENEEITGSMRGEGDNDPVSEFIGKLFAANIKFLFDSTKAPNLINVKHLRVYFSSL